MTDYRYKWVATTLMGDPAPEYAERAIARGWRKAERCDVPFDEVPLTNKDGFELYCMPATAFDQQSLAFKRAAEQLEEAEHHWMVMSPNAPMHGDLMALLKEWYRPENLVLYPDRKAELDAANASREKFFRERLHLPEDVIQKLLAE